MLIQESDGEISEILLDAKGRYGQFVDSDTGVFADWWAKQLTSGLGGELEKARRQVRVANGRPVQWWCAQPEVARAFTTAIRADRELRGRMRAVYKPMPGQEG